ncbi:uncharacterized protein LOC134256847 [Saccostrea cucullata]|uniref:uncharacterized protein LOC134256847 n=1 Tax=Saccostrea cuccullata TaxID=36930 RepID=UPI002ED25647
MDTKDNVSEQLHDLARKVTELEKSNKTILKSLNERERSQKLVDKKWTDFGKTLESMKGKSDTSDKEIRWLKENLHRLNGKVEELSQSVRGLKHGHKEGARDQGKVIPHSQNGPKITIRKLQTVSDGKSVPSTKTSMSRPKEKDVTLTKEQVSVSEDHKSEPSENKEREISRAQKSPMTVNELGLRGRMTPLEDDNRVRLMQGKSIEKGQASNLVTTPSSEGVKEKREDRKNLPTRDEIKRRTKGRQIRKNGERPKLTVQHAAGTRNEYKNLAGLSKDPEAVPDIREMSEWKTMAEAERKRGLSLTTIERGAGPGTCLLLDISGSMEGDMFEEMITTAKTFIKGISDVARVLEIPENVGIATFGEQTRVVQHMTNDYDRVLETLDLLTPGGPSPMSAGLYMALACCLGHIPNTTVHEVPVAPRIILITDGRGTPDIIASGEDDFPTNKETNLMKYLWMNEAVEDLEKRKHRVYCVTLEKTETDMIELICKKTHGKIYKSEEISKLVRMTQNTVSLFFYAHTSVNIHEEVVHLGKTSVWVEWDCGHKNTYTYNALLGYDILVVEEPRVLKGEMIAVGCLVERGEHWRYGDQDGGKGNVGVVINVKENGLITVRWPNKEKVIYKFGFDGFFEVKICDPKKVHGSVGSLKTHVWGSGSALGGGTEPPLEGATASDTPVSTDFSGKKMIMEKQGEEIKDKDINKTMSVEELNKRNNQMSVKIEEALSPTRGSKLTHVSDIQWRYLKNDLWCEFSQDINRKIEKAYGRNKQGSTILDLEEHAWKVSFSDMKMKCEKTNTTMQVQRNEISQ